MTPSYLAAANASAASGSAGEKAVNACLPCSRARITPLRRGISAIVSPCGIGYAVSAPLRAKKSRFDKREASSLASRPAFRSTARVQASAQSSAAKVIMIIDCHGHYTTEPKDLGRFRQEQIAAGTDRSKMPARASLKISDDEIREGLEGAQLKFQRERHTDLVIFSPRAMGMGHHIGDYSVSL